MDFFTWQRFQSEKVLGDGAPNAAAADALDGVKVNGDDAIFERGGEDASLVGGEGAPGARGGDERGRAVGATNLEDVAAKGVDLGEGESTTVRPPVERASRTRRRASGSGMDSAHTTATEVQTLSMTLVW